MLVHSEVRSPLNPKALRSDTPLVQVAITRMGRRADAYRQFLEPVLSRDNLTVVINAQTKRIAMDTTKSKPRAVGVEIQSIQVCY